GRLNVCNGIPGCGTPATPDFSLSVSPSSVSVSSTGGTATYTVAITRNGGFADPVDLSVSGLPAGATGSFSSNPATGNSSTLTVTVAASTPANSYPLTVTGTSGVLSRTASATLVVQPSAPPNFSLSISPSSVTVPRAGGTAVYTVTITRTGGFT